MSISETELDEFIRIWERKIGRPITRDEAHAKAALLVDLYVRLSERLPSERDDATSHQQAPPSS